jgi:hypothetical protein
MGARKGEQIFKRPITHGLSTAEPPTMLHPVRDRRGCMPKSVLYALNTTEALAVTCHTSAEVDSLITRSLSLIDLRMSHEPCLSVFCILLVSILILSAISAYVRFHACFGVPV